MLEEIQLKEKIDKLQEQKNAKKEKSPSLPVSPSFSSPRPPLSNRSVSPPPASLRSISPPPSPPPFAEQKRGRSITQIPTQKGFFFVLLFFCLVLFGFVWFCLVLFGFVWFCLVLFGFVWFCLVLFGFVKFVF